MLDIKQNKLMIFLSLLIVISIIYMFIGKQTTLQNKMQNALENHDHENALIFASQLLEKEPNNQEAVGIITKSGQIFLYLQMAQSKIPNFKLIKDQDTGQQLFYLQGSQSSVSDLENASNNVIVTAEKVYEEFNAVRAYTAKAKNLDSKFKTTLDFEKRLDSAQMYVLNILVANVFDVGNSVYSTVIKDYEKKSAIINTASNSEYLDVFLKVQSAWAPMETPIAEIKHNIDPLLDKIDNTGQLVSEFKAGKLTDSLLSYIQVLKKSVDTLLTPIGNNKDFIELANSSTNEYKKAQSKLQKALVGLSNVKNFSSLVNAIVDYKLFNHDSTVNLINKNQEQQGV